MTVTARAVVLSLLTILSGCGASAITKPRCMTPMPRWPPTPATPSRLRLARA